MSIIDTLPPISQQIWDAKYRLKGSDGTVIDQTIEDTWLRVATALAAAEKPEEQAEWASRFYSAMEGFKFIPAGRILAGAGTARNVTLMNCYVMGTIPDSLDGIFSHLREAALTMQQGGGIGYDFSTLRPKGALVKGVDADASGPLSFMDVWDSMCKTLMSAGARRGAMMAVMHCQHPDILEFIEAKRTKGRLTQFNMSVLVTDEFINQVKIGGPWALVFNGVTVKTVVARDLWDAIMRSTYDHAEPGVIFIDRVNHMNNLNYCETIASTNPCGEQPLPPYGSCDLGSINLAALVQNPFTDQAFIDANDFEWIVSLAVRMLDNVYDVTRFPLAQQRREGELKRRIGLGVTGLANALAMCGYRYGTQEAAEVAASWMQSIEQRAYFASAELAAEKGAFPLFDLDSYRKSATWKRLPTRIKGVIHDKGLRNSHLMSVAPTGTISLFAGNVSSGVEPPFAYRYTRKVLQPDGTKVEEAVEDYAYALFKRLTNVYAGEPKLPPCFVTAQDLSPGEHLLMLAAVQMHCDTSVSKTINLPRDISFEDFKDVYIHAHLLGCKSCTTYRPNDVTGSVLSVDELTTPKAITNAEEKFPYACPDLDQTEQPAEDWAQTFRELNPLVVSQAVADDAARQGVPLPEGTVVASPLPLSDEDDEPEDLIPVRPEVLIGKTYKVRWSDGVGDHAYYVTINDASVSNGPFEVFINSKCVESQAWIAALTRMISAVFRRGGDLRFVAEELEAVVDPKGGAWIEGSYVPSLPSLIGQVIRRHLSAPLDQGDEVAVAVQDASGDWTNGDFDDAAYTEVVNQAMKAGKQCPTCGSFAIARIGGCENCLDCGWSRCG